MKWLQTTFGDACQPTLQVNPASKQDGTFRYIDISGIDRDTKAISNADSIACADAPSRARKQVRAGDVLVSTVRPNLNAVAWVPAELDGEIASTGFTVLRVRPKVVEAKYIFYRAQHSEFVNYLVANATGASYPAVSDAIVKRAPLSLPSLPEQRRIVEILDQADALRKRAREADAKAARILPALFLKMFGDPASNPMGWPTKKLSKIADTTSGGTPDTKNSTYYGGDIPWVKSGELAARTVRRTQQTLTGAGLRNSSAKWIDAGAILLAMYGATVGQVSRLAIRATTNQAVCAITPHEDMEAEYLVEFLRLSKQRLLDLRVGGAQPNISQQIIRSLDVPIPPGHLRQRFAMIVAQLEKQLSELQTSQPHLDNLFESLMQHAFSGQLTAKWRAAHMQELLVEMQEQARALNLPMANAAPQ
jgi:type I restriction enzyme S subunit